MCYRLQSVASVACVLGAILLVAGCSRSGSSTARNGATGVVAGNDELVIGEGIRQGNVVIFPVSTKVLRGADRFITLDEGLKEGVVEIQELGAGDANAVGNSSVANVANIAHCASVAEQEPQTTPDDRPQATNAEPQTQPAMAQNQSEQTVEQQQQPVDQQAGGARPRTANAPVMDDPFGGQINAPAEAAGQFVNQGAEVNRLAVINRSERPLYLMPGEIVVGGQQDRVIGQEYIIEAKTGPVPIDVFCVEHGRWQEKGGAQLSLVISQSQSVGVQGETISLAHDADTPEKAAEQSAKGKFVATVGNLSKVGRMAVQDAADQSEVWSKVAQENEKSGAAVGNETGAFTENYAADKVVQKLGPLMEKLKQPVAETKNVVGVIVAVNGKVESMDVFETTPLFQKLWPKLLKSYCFDAINADQESKDLPQCTADDAKKFLTATTTAQQSEAPGQDESQRGKGMVAARRGDQTVLFSLHDRNSRDEETAGTAAVGGGFGGGGMGGGLGGAVHAAGFAK